MSGLSIVTKHLPHFKCVFLILFESISGKYLTIHIKRLFCNKSNTPGNQYCKQRQLTVLGQIFYQLHISCACAVLAFIFVSQNVFILLASQYVMSRRQLEQIWTILKNTHLFDPVSSRLLCACFGPLSMEFELYKGLTLW